MNKVEIQKHNEKLWGTAQYLEVNRQELIELELVKFPERVLTNEYSYEVVRTLISLLIIPNKGKMLYTKHNKVYYKDFINTPLNQVVEATIAAYKKLTGDLDKAAVLTTKTLDKALELFKKVYPELEIIKGSDWYLRYPIRKEFKQLSPLMTLMGSVPPPMIVHPREWREDESGGLLTIDSSMILTKGFRDINKPKQRQLLNYLGRQEYTVNTRWRQVLKRAFVAEAKEIMESGENIDSKLNNLKLKELEARKRIEYVIKTGGTWHQFWQYDSRGRVYPRSYTLTTMGAEWEKSLCKPTHQSYSPLKLNDKLSLKEWFNPKDAVHKWIAIEIANRFGLDKETFLYRVKWVAVNIENLLDFVHLADEPNLYENAVHSLYDHYKGIASPIMVHLDATNQALQLHSVLMHDEQGALYCNVKMREDGKQGDAYQALADELNKLWNVDIFTRKNCKYAVMTAFYNKMNPADKIDEKLGRKGNEILSEILKRQITVDEWEESVRIALRNRFPNAIDAMNTIQDVHSLNPRSRYTWDLPNGFAASCISMMPDSKKITIYIKDPLGNSKEIKVAFSKRWETASEYYRGLAANIIHSVDGFVLQYVAERMESIGAPFEPIHDDYGTTPNFVDQMRKFYKEALLHLYDSNILEDITKDIFGYPLHFKKGELTKDDIQKSIYLLS